MSWLKQRREPSPEDISHFGRGGGLLQVLLRPRSARDMERVVGDGRNASVIMSPVQWIARAFIAAPWQVLRQKAGDEREPLPDHALLELLRRPNYAYDGITFTIASVVSWLVEGNVYWIIVRDERTREPLALWWAPGWAMRPASPDDGSVFISHYEYRPKGRVIEYPIEDVVHLRWGMNPEDPRLGQSQLAAGLPEVFSDVEAAKFTATILSNMGVPGLLVSPASADVVVEDGEAEATKQKLIDATTGDERGKPLVMKGPTKVERLSFSASDLELGNVRDVSEERVCALLGVPPAVVSFGTGLQQTKVGATLREMREQAWHDCIIPNQRIIAAQVGEKLLPEFEPQPKRFAVTFDLSRVEALRDDRDKKAAWLDSGVKGGWVRVDQAKREVGLEVFPGDEVYLRSVATVEVGAGERRERGSPEPPKEKKARPTPVQTRLIELFERSAPNLQGAFERRLGRFFAELGASAAAAAQGVLGNGAATRSRRGSRKGPEDEIDADAIAAGMAWSEATAEFARAYEAHYLSVFEDVVRGLRTVTELAVDLPDFVAREILADGGRRAGLVDLRAQTRARLFRELELGRSLGEGPADLVRRIRDFIPAGPYQEAATRAKVIARTETMHAQRASALRAYEEMDTVSAVMLFDDRLGFGDEDCAARNGQIVSIEEARGMLDAEHPNGTLSYAPVIG